MDGFKYEINFYTNTNRSAYDFGDAKVEFKDKVKNTLKPIKISWSVSRW